MEKRTDQNKDKLIEADAQYVTLFESMLNDSFIWDPGEYELELAVDAEPKQAKVVKTYRFTLFESDAEDLTKSKDDYKFGDGIFWYSGKHPGVMVQIRPA